jgi:hypothetical protein
MSVDEDLLREMQAMNRNITLMLANQVREERRFVRLEHLINVSTFPRNNIFTSTGFSIAPMIHNSTNVVYCYSQAAPVYTKPRAHMYEDQGRQPLSHHVVGAPSTYVPTLHEMRKDHRLIAEAEERCAEIDAPHLGNCQYISSKKARGLLRAGGEASKHVHIEWPHDHILVGPDKDRVYYKNLNMEQWAYGYTCIMENQSNYKIKDNMITHLKHVFQDSMSYGFRRAKGAHAEILNEMELGKINC